MHARIADHHHLIDVLGEYTRLADDLPHVLVQEPSDAGVELAEIGWIVLSEGNPRHEVTAEGGLRIQARDRGELLAGFQVDERGDDACRPDVGGQTEFHGRRVARLH